MEGGGGGWHGSGARVVDLVFVFVCVAQALIEIELRTHAGDDGEASDACAARNDEKFRRLCRRHQARKVAPPKSSPQDRTRPTVHATPAPIDCQQGIQREGDPRAGRRHSEEASEVRMEDHGKLLCRLESHQDLARPTVHALPAPLQPGIHSQQGIPQPALQHASFLNLRTGPLSRIDELSGMWQSSPNPDASSIEELDSIDCKIAYEL